MSGIKVGERFPSLADLESEIQRYQEENFVQLTLRDTSTLENARKRAPKRVEGANNSLRYYYYTMHFTCVCGGKKYKSKGQGARPCQQTIKQECKAGIKLALSDDKQFLVVTDMKEEHNHPVSKEIYSHLPKQRKLGADEKEDAEAMIKLGVNKKLLQLHVQESTGKAVTLKDLSNIQTQWKDKTTKNDLAAVVKQLQEVPGSTVEVFKGDGNMLTGIFFQDCHMKANFKAFPEVVLVDATYKLVNLRMPLYLMLCVDGNGQSEIVASCITLLETEEGIRCMVDTFKTHNPDWGKVSMVMTDKDLTERSVFGAAFPQATLHLCLFHVLRSFRREVTCEKFGISSGERELVLTFFQRMVYPCSLSEYQSVYRELPETGLDRVVEFFNQNWHECKEQWVEGLKGQVLTLGETTNNRLESINSKIKSVCSKCATLEHFFQNFMSILTVLGKERSHNIVMAMVKRRAANSPEAEEINTLLTPYAARQVIQQLDLSIRFVMYIFILNFSSSFPQNGLQ